MPTTRLNLSNPHWLSRNLTESWLTIGPKGDPKQEMDPHTTQGTGRAKCPAAAHMAAAMQQGVHFGGWMPQIQACLGEISYFSVHFSLAEPWNGLWVLCPLSLESLLLFLCVPLPASIFMGFEQAACVTDVGCLLSGCWSCFAHTKSRRDSYHPIPSWGVLNQWLVGEETDMPALFPARCTTLRRHSHPKLPEHCRGWSCPLWDVAIPAACTSSSFPALLLPASLFLLSRLPH